MWTYKDVESTVDKNGGDNGGRCVMKLSEHIISRTHKDMQELRNVVTKTGFDMCK